MGHSINVHYCKDCNYAAAHNGSAAVQGHCPQCSRQLRTVCGPVERVEGFVGIPSEQWVGYTATQNGVKTIIGHLFYIYDDGVFGEHVTIADADLDRAKAAVEKYIGKRNLKHKVRGNVTILR